MTPRRRIAAAAAITVSLCAVTCGAPSVARARVPRSSRSVAATPFELASIAYVAGSPQDFDTLSGLTSDTVTDIGQQPTTGTAIADAISPDGASAVFADFGADLTQLTGIRTATPTAGPTLDLSAYAGEGGSNFQVHATAVALGHDAGVAALDSQGILQLRLVDGAWQIDDRVRSPGINEVGEPHQPGWIRFGKSGQPPVFDSVSISNVALPNGKYLALSTDRGSIKGRVDVVEGVGTAKPKLVGVLRSPDLEQLGAANDTGTGGVAFAPATATRALLATNDGFDVIDLSKPAKPRILSHTTVKSTDPVSAVAVAPDSEHFAVANGATIRTYTDLLAATGRPKRVGKLLPATGETQVESVTYPTNSRLLVEASSYDAVSQTTTTAASLVTHARKAEPQVASAVPLSGNPVVTNSLAAYPAAPTPTLHVDPLTVKVGRPATIKLHVHDGYGDYRYAVKGGKLPPGLSLSGHTITGTPKRTGGKHVTLRAKDQYGGAVYATVHITVR